MRDLILLPRLEQDKTNKDYWHLYWLDKSGHITCESFKASKKEAEERKKEKERR